MKSKSRFAIKIVISVAAMSIIGPAHATTPSRTPYKEVCGVNEFIGSSCDKNGFNCTQSKVTPYTFNGDAQTETFHSQLVSGIQVDFVSEDISGGHRRLGTYAVSITIKDAVTGSTSQASVNFPRLSGEKLPENAGWLSVVRKNGDGVTVNCARFTN